MMTQLEAAKNGIVTPLMKQIAAAEGIALELLLKRIKQGTIVIPVNKRHTLKKPCGIGLGLRTKINANIGTSTDKPNIKEELKKLAVAEDYGADAIMDLSIGGDIKNIRKEILKHTKIPLGTVPVYEISVNAHNKNKNFLKFDSDDILEVLESKPKKGWTFLPSTAGSPEKP